MSSPFLDTNPDRETQSADDRRHWPSLLEEATREVFGMMLNSEIASEPSAEDSVQPVSGMYRANRIQPSIEVVFHSAASRAPEDPEVTAVVGIAGDLCGVMNFACGTTNARKMAARMLGIEEAEAGDQQWDAIGEICNMVAGNFKAKLPGVGERCMLSVPTIVVGSNYCLRAIAGGLRLEYRFRVNDMLSRIILELQQ